MKHFNLKPYETPRMEIIALECEDIIAASGEQPPEEEVTPPTPGGYVPDDNIFKDW